MNRSKRHRLLRDRIARGEYTPKSGLLLPAERGKQPTKSKRKDVMFAIIDDRQRGLRGCKIVVGGSSLHAQQQPTLRHEPAPERLDGVTLLTATHGLSADTHQLAPPNEATPWRNVSPDTALYSD